MNTPVDWTDPRQVAAFIAENALLEDRALEDSATKALGVFAEGRVECLVLSREDIVSAGIPLAAAVFSILPGGAVVEQLAAEGERVSAGGTLARLAGPAASVLMGERVFLNMLGRLCGIATLTAEYVELCRGTGVEVLDTRKTTPCMRALEKYAVRMGGGTNHRFSLADMAMLKDNHLAACGGAPGIKEAVHRIRASGVPLEIEVDTISQLETVIPLGPQRILLDNMSLSQLSDAVRIARGTGIYLEASGGITASSVRDVAETGVNGISVGALTHSVRSSDIGLDWNHLRERS